MPARKTSHCYTTNKQLGARPIGRRTPRQVQCLPQYTTPRCGRAGQTRSAADALVADAHEHACACRSYARGEMRRNVHVGTCRNMLPQSLRYTVVAALPPSTSAAITHMVCSCVCVASIRLGGEGARACTPRGPHARACTHRRVRADIPKCPLGSPDARANDTSRCPLGVGAARVVKTLA